MVNVYKMNNCIDWWAGESLEECVIDIEDYYLEVIGDTEEAVECPRILTEEEMDKLIYIDEDGEFGDTREKYTFRQALENLLKMGLKPPFMFASQEY